MVLQCERSRGIFSHFRRSFPLLLLLPHCTHLLLVPSLLVWSIPKFPPEVTHFAVGLSSSCLSLSLTCPKVPTYPSSLHSYLLALLQRYLARCLCPPAATNHCTPYPPTHPSPSLHSLHFALPVSSFRLHSHARRHHSSPLYILTPIPVLSLPISIPSIPTRPIHFTPRNSSFPTLFFPFLSSPHILSSSLSFVPPKPRIRRIPTKSIVLDFARFSKPSRRLSRIQVSLPLPRDNQPIRFDSRCPNHLARSRSRSRRAIHLCSA